MTVVAVRRVARPASFPARRRRPALRAVAALCVASGLFGAQPGLAQEAAALTARIDALEGELRRLTAMLEQSQFERRQAEQDFEARLQDLEFRIIELEGGDPTAAFRADAETTAEAEEAELPAPAEADPAAPSATAPTATQPAAPQAGAQAGAQPQLAPAPRPLGNLRGEVSRDERAAFEAAMRDLETLGPDAGRRGVESFVALYPDSGLAAEATARLGEAFAEAGRWQEAARAYLQGVRDHPGKPGAAENLLGLGASLAALGQIEQACAAFSELASRYADAAPSIRARAAEAASRAGC